MKLNDRRIPYFVIKQGAGGQPLHYWQPSKRLRQAGHAPRRLSDDPVAAAGEALELHAQLRRAPVDGRPVGPARARLPAGVYVIGPEDGPFKIGVARDPAHRRKQLQVGSPYPLALYYFRVIPGLNAHVIEHRCHHILRRRRRTGEWFDVPLDRAINVVEAAIGALTKLEV